MTEASAPRLSLTSVRYALEEDLEHLADIETAADRMLLDHLLQGGAVPTDWPPPTSGRRRGDDGVVLVAGRSPVGFAHLVDLSGSAHPRWHLEQIAVRPEASRRGIGRMLLRAAMGVVLERGGQGLTLTTFEDVPWNAPWYRREGFVVADLARAPLLRRQREVERHMGLDLFGPRVAMVRSVEDRPVPRAAVSVIPLRMRGGSLEVFVQHRAMTMDFAPGAVVFPGGRVDARDERAARRRGTEVARECAVRELLEEAGAKIDPGGLIPWDRWVTPVGYPRRFDVLFFVLPVPDGGEFTHVTSEATHSEWMRVTALVERTERGELDLVPPTRTIVDELAALGTLEAVLDLSPPVEPVRHDLTGPRPRR